ncbi:MAG: tRNA guanosine(34) transglycosylase Tgt [Alphaproteobacteria bacterium]
MTAPGLGFAVEATDGAARAGRLTTAHGTVRTPAFMPVGTQAAIKAMSPEAVAATGTEIVLANTYHLMLRPGAERIERLGGVRRFMSWPGPLLTDSGGFQVMSLAKLRTVDDHGVTFRSHIDGSLHALTPERAVAIQHSLDSTITMVLDECVRLPAGRATIERSLALTHAWAERGKRAFAPRAGYGLFGIVQGGTEDDLRVASAAALVGLDFDGYAIGGLAVGEPQAAMFHVLDVTVPCLPAHRPRYLMGVGKPADVVGAVARGIDMFDCVLPTRSGRTGQAFTRRGTVNLHNARHADDPRPLEDSCPCPACRGYSRAYLHHLVRCGEILGAHLLTWHNLQHYQGLMADLRAAIRDGRIAAVMAAFAASEAAGDVAAYERVGGTR